VRPRLPAFFGWRIVAAGAAIQAMQSMLVMQAFTHYVVVLKEEFAWSATLFSVAFSMTRAESGFLGPIQGWMIDRFGPRSVMRVGLVIMGLGFMLFSTIQNPMQFFIFYFMIAFGASLGGFLSITTSIVNWFDRHRSKALAATQTGFALGGMLTVLVALSFDQFGWRPTAFASGVLVFVIGLPLSQVIIHRPEDIGQHIDGIDPATLVDEESEAEDAIPERIDFTMRQALRTRSFWLISVGHASALLVVGAVMVHVSPYLTEAHGYSLAQASFFVGALTISQLGGQLSGGYLGDRGNKRAVIAVAMAGHMTGFLLLAFAQNALMIWGFVALHGWAWGARGPLMQSMRADYFGRGPLVAGIMRDATGSYSPGFAVLATLAGFGSVFFLMATPPGPPGREIGQVEAAAAAPVGGDAGRRPLPETAKRLAGSRSQ
jgi:sugar phosphate permease